jgi:adenine-specific DNA-methyltransferase
MQTRIALLVNSVISTKEANASADTTTLEREIDQHVYALYGLTPEEIAIVESGNPAK